MKQLKAAGRLVRLAVLDAVKIKQQRYVDNL